MKFQHVSVAIAAFALLASGATAASAQSAKKTTRPAASSGAAAPLPTGPSIPGFCVLTRDAIIGASMSGKSVIARMAVLKQQAEAELGASRSSLEADVKAFQDQRATLPADQVQSREAALNARAQAFQGLAQQRSAELQRTQQKEFGTIAQAADPIVRQVFVQRGCSVLIDGNTVISDTPAMDITSTVIQGLDGKLQTLNFEREHIDPSQVAQAAAPR